MSEKVRLDWSSAEVHDGKLVIALDGRVPKDWKEAFEATTRLLNNGTWEEVTLKKGKVFLAPVTPGEEDRVRHFLESVVLQANSAIATPEEDDAQKSTGADEAKTKDAGESQEDREMTERLRAFTEADGGR